MVILAQSGGTGALIAVVVIVAGFVLGSIAAAVARRLANASKQPEAVQSSAGAIATLAFSTILIIALVIALGIVNEAALTQLGQDVVTFLPRLLSATIVMIIGNIVGAIIETGVERSLGHVAFEVRQRVPLIVKWVIQGFALVIAANQLGIDTTIILVLVASVFFGLALASALLAGLGGRQVASQVAAGRAVRRELQVGDIVRVADVEGEIQAIGSTSTQIVSKQRVVFVPNRQILDQSVEVIDSPARNH